jgi:hypothetical protein
MNKSILCFLWIFLSSCGSKNSEHADYWNAFFQSQKAIRSISDFSGKWKLLNGSFNHKREELEEKTKTEKFKLLFIVQKQKNGFQAIEKDPNLNLDKIQDTYLYSEYESNEWKGKPTYLFRRTWKLRGNAIYHPWEFLTWIEFLQNRKDLETLMTDTEVARFVCVHFLCKLEETQKDWTLSLAPRLSLQKLDGAFYKRITSFLERVDFTLDFKTLDTGKEAFQIIGENKVIKIRFNRNHLISNDLKKAEMKINLNATFYGIKISIQNWKYNFIFNNKKDFSFVEGRFTNIPDYSVTGRLGYIIPNGVINLFIPENMDEYFHNFFDLRKNGNKGKGNLWRLETKKLGGKFELTSHTEFEVPSKVFQFLSSNEKPSKEIFLEKLQDKIIETLKNSN